MIFSLSGGALSSAQTGRFLRPFLEWLFGPISDARFFLIQFLVRKSAHLIVYATLSALWFRAQRGPRLGWQARWALLALLVSMLVALGDELHQSFFLSRSGSPWDVLLDSVGALLAQAAIFRLARRRV